MRHGIPIADVGSRALALDDLGHRRLDRRCAAFAGWAGESRRCAIDPPTPAGQPK